ncbi:MAG TPA: methyltransferase domain-containing protein [Mycobacteriales bacterium]
MTGEYTHGHHPSVLGSHATRTAATSAAYLLPLLRSGQSVLDVGCGPGTVTADLARLVAPGQVVGIEPVDEPLAAARALDTSATFELGDVYALRFEDDSFDVVHGHQVLQHLTDPVAALREMRRVCRPGGIVACRDADYASFTWAPAEPRLDRWLDVYRRLARHNGAEPDAGRYLTTWFAEAGFTDVTGSASAWSYCSPQERGTWARTWEQRVLSSAYATQSVAAGLTTDRELQELAAGWRAWGAAPVGFFGMLHGEVIARA